MYPLVIEHNYGKSACSMGKSTISTGQFELPKGSKGSWIYWGSWHFSGAQSSKLPFISVGFLWHSFSPRLDTSCKIFHRRSDLKTQRRQHHLGISIDTKILAIMEEAQWIRWTSEVSVSRVPLENLHKWMSIAGNSTLEKGYLPIPNEQCETNLCWLTIVVASTPQYIGDYSNSIEGSL